MSMEMFLRFAGTSPLLRGLASMLVAASAAGCSIVAVPLVAPELTIQVERAQYSATGEVKSPSWKVQVSTKNPDSVPLEFGESLLLIETLAGSAEGTPIDDVTFHVRRLRSKDGPKSTSISDRYMTLFGYTVEMDGTAIIPFGALSDLTGGKGGISLFIASLASPKIPAFPGGGFGRVAAHGVGTFDAEVIAPVGPKQRLGVVVALPSIRAVAGADQTPRHFWCEFTIGDTNVGDKLGGGVKHEAPLGAEALAALVRNEQLPPWKRRLAFNWLVEDHPQAATLIIAEVLRSQSQRSLFRSAVANAGLLKSRETAAPLVALLRAEPDRGLTLLLLEALSRIGDRAVAEVIRSRVDDKDAEISRAAMLALGSLRDTASTSHLLEIFGRSKEYRPAHAAACALVEIGDGAAIQRLFQTLSNPKAPELVRRAVASALTPALAHAHINDLVVVLSKKDFQYGLASDIAEALGRANSEEALGALRAASEHPKAEIADLAIRAMTRNEQPAWRNAVISMAASVQAKHRTKALYYLGLFEVKAGVATVNEAASSSDSDVRKAACQALERMKESKPAACRELR